MRRTKILATIGPACANVETLLRMIDAGLDAVRVNFSHGSRSEQVEMVGLVRQAAEQAKRPIPVVQDLQGTKVRIGPLKDGRVQLEQGQEVRIETGTAIGDASHIFVDDPLVVREARVDAAIILGDGDVALRVVRREGDAVVGRVEHGGLVRQGAGITAPGTALPGGLTDKDLDDMDTGIALGVDYVALSFVRNAEEVETARAEQQARGGDAPLIAKIEREEALDDLLRIIDTADGILVARGDLGIALPPEKVPVAQKRMLHACAHAGRLSITATQMLESMVTSPRPTRAEASDVANAILDGTHAVMLSGETAVGRHPVLSVRTMARIAAATEQAAVQGVIDAPVHRGVSERSVPDAIALACAVTAEDLDARTIIAFTQTGKTAHRVAKHRPRVPILAATPDPRVERRLNLVWGVTPILVPEADTLDGMVRTAEQAAKARGLVSPGDVFVVTGGDVGVPGSTNLMRVGQVD